jgi:hypothetical protein
MKYHITADNKFECSLDYSLRGTTKSYKEEVTDHIKSVVEGRDHVYLLFSGGMDSRFLALLLLEMGIDFTAITFSSSSMYDDYDSYVSKDFSKRHAFKHELFNIGSFDVWSCAERYYEQKEISFVFLHAYYIFLAIEKYNKPNSVFLTGAGAEFRIKDKKIKKNFLISMLQVVYPNIYNFISDRILFSYFDEPIIKDNWQDESSYTQYYRDKLYNSIYPDKLEIIEKSTSNHTPKSDYFYKMVNEKYGEEEFFKRVITGNFTLDLEEYYNGGVNNGN